MVASHLRLWCAGLLCTSAVLLGCGNPGPPLPPSLMLPQPVGDLSAQRTADTVALRWTMPTRSTDRVPLRGDRHLVMCRAIENGPCEHIATTTLPSDSPSVYTDLLPHALRSGPLHLLTYRVRFTNGKGTDAGTSNPAFTAAGLPPPTIGSPSATATAGGILVRWTTLGSRGDPAPRNTARFVRLERERLPEPGKSREPSGAGSQSERRRLESSERGTADNAWTPDHVLDTEATLDGAYRYEVRLVETLNLGSHRFEVSGAGATTPVLAAKDVFAPATPEGLEAAANAEGHAIDLSWSANEEADLAGYFVYRGVGPGSPGTRISGEKPVVAPGWSDTTAKPGILYSYAVSAVDHSGNESPRTPERMESLPQP